MKDGLEVWHLVLSLLGMIAVVAIFIWNTSKSQAVKDAMMIARMDSQDKEIKYLKKAKKSHKKALKTSNERFEKAIENSNKRFEESFDKMMGAITQVKEDVTSIKFTIKGTTTDSTS